VSTKIYGAYQYHGNVEQLMEWLFSTREKYKDHKKKEISGIFGGEKVKSFMALASLLEKAVEEQHNIAFNYRSEACVYFSDGNIYVVIFELPKHLMPTEPEFTDFHYQNQTDRPEAITEEEWDKRRDTWDKIMKHNSFGENGLTFSFTPPYFGIDIARYVVQQQQTKTNEKEQDGNH
jgi:hypothetical protein